MVRALWILGSTNSFRGFTLHGYEEQSLDRRSVAVVCITLPIFLSVLSAVSLVILIKYLRNSQTEDYTFLHLFIYTF